jgi:hypothetical protein
MAIADNNFHYEESSKDKPISGWYRVTIREITEPKITNAGNATGFWIRLDVTVGTSIEKRDVWLSFDHQSEMIVRKSTNIGAMLRMMFPATTDDSEYVGESFWLNFYQNEGKDGKKYENYFDYKRNVSLDGNMTLEGKVIDESDRPEPVAQPKVKLATETVKDSSDVPF